MRYMLVIVALAAGCGMGETGSPNLIIAGVTESDQVADGALVDVIEEAVALEVFSPDAVVEDQVPDTSPVEDLPEGDSPAQDLLLDSGTEVEDPEVIGDIDQDAAGQDTVADSVIVDAPVVKDAGPDEPPIMLCEPRTQKCIGDRVVLCTEEGQPVALDPCENGCYDGHCVHEQCEIGETMCGANNSVSFCNGLQTWEWLYDCGTVYFCKDRFWPREASCCQAVCTEVSNTPCSKDCPGPCGKCTTGTCGDTGECL